MSNYRYLFADLLTNEILAELPLTGVNFTQQLNSAGTLSGTIQLAGSDPAVLNVDAGTTPARTAIYVDRDGVLVWGGVIWGREYNSANQHLTIQAREFESYLERRRITTTQVFQNVDQLFVAQQLVNTMNAQTNGNIGITVGSETSGVLISRTYYSYELKSVYSALLDLSKSTDGFDFNIQVAYDGGGNPTKTLVLSYPRSGTSYYRGAIADQQVNLVKNPIPSTSVAVSPQETWQIVNRGTGGAGSTSLTSSGAVDTVTTAASTNGYSFAVTGGTTEARIPVIGGQTYTMSMYATSSVSDVRQLGATFYDSAGGTISSSGGADFTMPSGVEVRLWATLTAPLNAVSCRIYGGATTGSIIRPLGSTMTWRYAMVDIGTALNNYFSGNTVATDQWTTYAWTGTAQASSSLYTLYELSPSTPVFEFPAGNVVEYNYPEDGAIAANLIYVVGAGSNEGKQILTATDATKLAEGWPLLEDSANFADITDLTLLGDLASGQVAAVSYPPTTMKLVAPPFESPELGTYKIGDDVRVRILDDRFPTGLDTIYRIVSLSLTAGENGPERVTLTLTLPTATTI